MLTTAGVAACRASAPSRGNDGQGNDEDAELAELFSDLSDQRHTVDPITPEERAARRQRLAGLLADNGLDGLICEHGATLEYLTGVRWGLSERLFAYCQLADGAGFFLAPAFEGPRAEERIRAAGIDSPEVVLWDEHEYASAPLAAALRERRVERVAVDPRLRFFAYDGLAEAFGRESVVSGHAVVRTLRGCKEPHELALMRRACELTQQALGAVAERLQPGLTGQEVGRWVRTAQERLGLVGTWVLPLVGPEAAFPHGKGGATPLEKGGVLLVDTGGALHGYQSDITRTWVVGGPPTVEVEEVWHAVRDAQTKAYEALRPGVPCREIDAVARRAIAESGYGGGYETFFHRVGHGIGLEGHEEPYLDGGNELELAPGMTFSDEPGIYLYDRFGVRIEDIIVITEDGADHFGAWQRSVLSPV